MTNMSKAVLIVVLILLMGAFLSGCGTVWGTTPQQAKADKIMRYDTCMKQYHSYVVCDKQVGQVVN